MGNSDTGQLAVVDLFSGPGGLAEGFAACRDQEGHCRYRVALSVEKDPEAYKTLLLRAFLRKFGADYPPEYYDFVNGKVTAEPHWETLDPERWQEALDETLQLELGTPEADKTLQQRITKLREKHGGWTVLLGGPPCQAYSVVGRVRNAGISDYDLGRDKRYRLYEQYVDVLWQLRPAVAIMENVKGILSATMNGAPILPAVLAALRHRRSELDGYRLYALAPQSGVRRIDGSAAALGDFVVRAEEHGVPQARHRVFVVCIRSDVAASLSVDTIPRLKKQPRRVALVDVIGDLPRLRSRLSRGDSPAAWREAVLEACRLVGRSDPLGGSKAEQVKLKSALSLVRDAMGEDLPPTAKADGQTALAETCPGPLREWLSDEKIRILPNNETRGHMPADLARYLFASAFSHAVRRSPKTRDFPKDLEASHKNWSTGRFDDRYRVQLAGRPSTTVTSHLSKDGHSFIHPDPSQVRSLTVREVARLQTFPDNYFFRGSRTAQYVQVGNAVPPFLAHQIAEVVWGALEHYREQAGRGTRSKVGTSGHSPGVAAGTQMPLVAKGTA